MASRPSALDINLEHCEVMDEAICGIGKDLAPFAERLVGGDEHGPAVVAGDKARIAPLVSAWSLLT
jgi:hypothetical protein